MSRSRWWAFALGWLATPAIAATIVVGPPPASIQSAINSAASGDTIQLSAGTYVQEVQVVSKSIDIVGAGQGVTIVQAPGPATHLTQSFTFGANFWTIIMVDNQAAPVAQTVNISDLTVDGGTQQDTIVPPIYGSSDRFFAIGYHNAGGTIRNVHTTNTRQTANFNELAGGGIVNASNQGAVTFAVTDSLIDFYQRGGLDLRGTTLTATISNSVINRGYVLTPNTVTATPNGIQYSGGAGGSILDNLVAGNISTVPGASATGILPFGAGTMTITGNTVNNNDLGIVAIQSAANLTISNNILNFTTMPGVSPIEGIVVQDNSGLSTLSANVMNNIPDVGIDLVSSTNQPFNLSQNRVIGGQTGLLITGNTATGPIVTMNGDAFSATTGYYIQEVSAPNDVWPSTSSVSFDNLVSGLMTFAQFNTVLTKIFDKHNDPALGLVLDFIPPSPPAVVTITPPSGPEAGGTSVTITGSNFVAGNTSVFFGGVAATNIVVNSATSMTVTTPPGTGIVDVRVTTTFGTVSVPAAYTYIPPPPAVVTIAPPSGPTAGGTSVTITGSNFVAGNTSVFFGGIAATNIVVNSATSMTVTTPPGTGTVDVRVTTTFGTVLVPAAYTYIPPPAVVTIAPPSGPTAGGTSVTITGSNFVAGNTSVFFGGVAATNIVVNSATSMTVTTPPGTGIVDVRVTTTFGTVLVPAAYTYIPPPPAVVTIAPPSGPTAGGTSVTITGSNFVAGNTSVFFGGVAATNIVVNSATSMTVTTPPGAGTVDVRVTTTFGTVLVTAAYTYLSPAVATVPVPVDSWWMLTALAMSLAVGGLIRRRR